MYVLCMRIHMSSYVYVYVYVHVYAHLNLYVYVYGYVYAYEYAHVYVQVYVCLHVYCIALYRKVMLYCIVECCNILFCVVSYDLLGK